MRDIDDLFSALTRSSFRQGFRLGAKAYLDDKELTPDEQAHTVEVIERWLREQM